MKSSCSPIIKKLATSAAGKKGRRLVSERRVWKIIDRLQEREPVTRAESTPKTPFSPLPGSAAALVLDQAPEPYAVRWDSNSDTMTFQCECGSEKPCAHLAALLVSLARRHPEHPALSPFAPEPETSHAAQDMFLNPEPAKTTPSRPSHQSVSKVHLKVAPVPPESLLDPEEDLLFFRLPDPVEYRSVFVLGEKDKMQDLNPAPGVEPSYNRTIRDLSGTEWSLLPALVAVREDGSTGSPKPWRNHAGPPPEIPDEMVTETKTANLVSALQKILETGVDVLTPRGKPWIYGKSSRIQLSFQPLLSAVDEEALFEPIISLENGKESVEGSLFSGKRELLLLDSRTAKARSISDSDGLGWFIRLLLSRRVLSSADIQARFHSNRTMPSSMKIVLPPLPDTLEVLTPSLVLEARERNDATELTPVWKYGSVLLSPASRSNVVVDTSGRHPRTLGMRDRKAESELFSHTEDIFGSSLSWRRGYYAALAGDSTIPLRLEMKLSELLSEFGNALMSHNVEIRLENRPIRRGGSLSINARKNGDMLEMNAGIADKNSDITNTLQLDSWLSQGGLVRTNEAYFTLTSKALEQLNFLRAHGMDDMGFLTTSPDNLSLIDAVYAELEVEGEEQLDIKEKRKLYARLSNFSADDASPVPENFHAVLRPYQFYGYAWLLYLHRNKLGGCLADDMGLGKTVQTLAYISRLKADGLFGCSLLVGPVVTLGNWEAEISRFAPHLKVYRYSGPAEKRVLPEPGDNVDLVIVSYQTLRNDAERFLDRRWDHIILDEAHYVKNSSSRTFKTVRSIRANHQLSLTGTPLENHLNELWSQMSFLNPGLLGTQHDFHRRFVKPVERGEDEEALGRLSDLVAPFLLRRKKADVLHDLPPKDETVLRCDMSDAQALAYKSVRDLYFQQVKGLLSSEGLGGSRIQIFTLLSKLRLLAIHPPLAGEQFSGISSGKMALMESLLDEILDENHKVLVFSQFLGALDQVEASCNRRSWSFSRLTGATRNREAQINRFTTDEETRVFLLSLRAGGVGINLTAADYVILLDPWWNPAVEAQAIDRAHRMGQKKPVMAYRLITSGTIEEKVLELQEKKKELIAGVLGEGELPKFSEDEILDLFQ